MADHHTNSTPSVQQQTIDAANGKSKDKAWPTKHRFTYVLITAIIGFLALTLKEWVPEEWRSLHEDIAQSEAVFRIQSDIAESTKTLRHAMAGYAGKKFVTCVSGGGIDGIPNPPEKYDGHCDDYIAALDIDLKMQRHAVNMDSDFAVHAGLPMTEGFNSVNVDLKSAEQRFVQLVEKVENARMNATSDDPLYGLTQLLKDDEQVQKKFELEHQSMFQIAKNRDEKIRSILKESRYLAAFFLVLALILGIIGKRYGIEASPEIA